MISAQQIKFIRSLQQKKYRDQHGLFVVEGERIVHELLHSALHVEILCAMPAWFDSVDDELLAGTTCLRVSPAELSRISGLKSPNKVLAVARQAASAMPGHFGSDELVLLLDDIRDPGNMGSILRTADWFGLRHVYCSRECVEVYNPKIIQASMGSFLRVRTHYTDLYELMVSLKGRLRLYGSYMEGTDVLRNPLELPAALVVGNEARGISDRLGGLLDDRLAIPAHGGKRSGERAESLNAAMAAGIIISCFRRGAWKS